MDFYVILGVDRAASNSDVRRAYRRLARKYHPDINPGDREAAALFRRVAEAYQTLSDPERRYHYDHHGTTPAPASDGVEFEGFDFSVSSSGESASTFGDLFADVFTGQVSGKGKGAQSVDLHVTLNLEFEQAIRGGEYEVTLTRVARCRACRGSGLRLVAESMCAGCSGTGQSRWTRGHMVFSRQCNHCDGTGRRRHSPCDLCRADGLVSRTEVVLVDLPAGIENGARVRVAGRGSVGHRAGLTGDLYVTVVTEPHAFFRRDGDDLHLLLPVAVQEAALGARVEVPTISDRVRLRIPPGSQSGQRFRLREQGVPSPRTGKPGDLIVEIQIVLPSVLDERSKELMRELAKIDNENVRAGLWKA